jgi:hypothetical protein
MKRKVTEGTWFAIPLRSGGFAIPQFVRKDELSRRAWIVQYSDENPSIVELEIPTDYDTDLERDGLYGAGAVEIVLTKLLTS